MSAIAEKLNSAIAIFSPAWALQRALNLRAYHEARRYTGAQREKNDTWNTTAGDADSEILRDLSALRLRSRDLFRNNPWASSILEALLKNIIGSGISPQAKEGDIKKNQEVEDYLNEAFKKIDLTGKQNFYQLSRLVATQFVENGEAFVRKFIEKDADLGAVLKLQVIEADQIYSNQTTSKSGNEIRAGIEIEKHTGRHVAYYINQHPGAYGMSREQEIRVPASDMIHIFLRTRPNQTRGVPLLAPAIKTMRDFGELLNSELVALRVASCVALLIKRNQHPTPLAKDEKDKEIQEYTPGMIAKLRPGEDVVVSEPKRPGITFAPFAQILLRAIAAAIGICYETISKDYSSTSFSSARTALLNERATYRFYQDFFISNFCDNVAEEILYLRYLQKKGKPNAKILWQPPRFEWVDPEKEVSAEIISIENNLETKASIAAKRGFDLMDVYAQRKIEVEKEKELGIQNVNANPRKDISAS